jgi:DNA ligase-1
MLEGFKPMLAVNYDDVTVKPERMVASPKLDGIRAVCFSGVLYSRSLKPIPNLHIQAWAKANAEFLEGVDGELIVGEPTAKDVFQKTTSGVMSIEKTPEFMFYAFDLIEKRTQNLPYCDRRYALKTKFGWEIPKCIMLVPDVTIENEEALLEYEKKSLELGFEGIMVRDADSKYKFGRSGKKKPEIMKVKRFVDNEYEVIGYVQEYENQNEAVTNELGRTARSTSKEGLVPKNSLGALILKDAATGNTFNCGGGFTKQQREDYWLTKDSLIGKLAKVKYFAIGVVDVPRFPVWLGFRDKDDM